MSSFDYLKSAIKQKGCTLQQVAEASGMTKGYLSQLLNAKSKARARRSLKRCIVSSGWSFPPTEKRRRGVW
ncbi:helix-turn-helix domain-containing protein [Klebsiella pneumoniae]|nr:helix-turn-helix domain-containing protein [Klebsiella pneumoniae]